MANVQVSAASDQVVQILDEINETILAKSRKQDTPYLVRVGRILRSDGAGQFRSAWVGIDALIELRNGLTLMIEEAMSPA